jgi:uncharacterized cupin superfamily protein
VSDPSFNLFHGELDEPTFDRPAYGWRGDQIGARLGAKLLGMSLYELEPGQKTFPYHYTLGQEEWLLVVSGSPTLRGPDGEQVLEAGDVVVFPEGPAGTHQIRNDGDEPSRVAIFSTKPGTAAVVYPDSDKVAVWSSGERHLVRDSPQLDYWDQEE